MTTTPPRRRLFPSLVGRYRQYVWLAFTCLIPGNLASIILVVNGVIGYGTMHMIGVLLNATAFGSGVAILRQGVLGRRSRIAAERDEIAVDHIGFAAVIMMISFLFLGTMVTQVLLPAP